jgi:hypothetical protein
MTSGKVSVERAAHDQAPAAAHRGQAPLSRGQRSRSRTLPLAALSLLAVSAAAYLLPQHPTHSLPYLPYLLLAACPLMHFFHHGHRHK